MSNTMPVTKPRFETMKIWQSLRTINNTSLFTPFNPTHIFAGVLAVSSVLQAISTIGDMSNASLADVFFQGLGAGVMCLEYYNCREWYEIVAWHLILEVVATMFGSSTVSHKIKQRVAAMNPAPQ